MPRIDLINDFDESEMYVYINNSTKGIKLPNTITKMVNFTIDLNT